MVSAYSNSVFNITDKLSANVGLTAQLFTLNNNNWAVEPYYQSLFNIPVEDGTSVSIINYYRYSLDRALVNDGKGRNYGVDITLERYLDKGCYWLLSGSVFDSQYTGGDGVWRDTRYNRGYIINGLIGKEWMVGKRKQNIFSANLRLSYQGSDRYLLT